MKIHSMAGGGGGVGVWLWAEMRLVMRLMRADAAVSCFMHIIVSFLGITYFFGIYSQKWMKGCEHLFVYLVMCTAKIFSESIETKCSAPGPCVRLPASLQPHWLCRLSHSG